MLKLLKNFKPLEWLMIAGVAVFVVGQVYLDLMLPDYMGDIVSLIQLSGMTGQVSISEIWSVGFKMLGIAFGSAACSIIVSYLAAVVSSGFARTIRSKMFRKVNSFSMEEMSRFSTSTLITRSTNDVTQVQMVVMVALRMLITAPAMAIGAITKIVSKSLTLSWITAIALVIMFGLVLIMFFFVVPKFKVMQKQVDRLNLVTRENLTGLRVVRAYGAEEYEEEKFEKSSEELKKTQLFVNRASAFLMPGMQLVMSCLALTIVWVGASLISNNQLALADMTIFTQYAMQVLMSFMMLAAMMIMLPRAAVSGTRINEVLETVPTINDGVGTEPSEQGTVEFKNVSFRYGGAEGNVLEDINVKINKGDTVAVIGSTGSGKSTFINLMPRFFDATEGEVLVDGVNVRDYKLEELYDKFGYVPQKSLLFSGTIESNIEYGKPDASEDEIQEALEIAQAADFVNSFEDGTGHSIAQGGKNVSGGQRQRLSIARAVVKKPEIFIFDDSFSALDYKTDKSLRKALAEKTSGATNIIVAQRIGTIMDADKIIVLDGGKIAGQGTHRELLENCDVYREIASSQLSEEELNYGTK